MALDKKALDAVFNEARSFSYWEDKSVSDAQLQAIYDLLKMGPTAANSCPARLVFVKSEEAKQRLKPHLHEGNVDKSMSAPAVAIVGMDLEFYEELPYLFPHTDARAWYVGKPEKIQHAAFLNTTLQGAYLITAIRSLGLDAGPMSGVNNETLDKEFFPDGKIKSLFICAIGYGVREKLHPRQPRLDFARACRIL
ncbi:MAG: malonic semialdehyde reductase [Gammaproteobacteria bacterium]